MTMKKKFFILITFIILLIASCGGDETITKDQLSGTWKLGDRTLTFIHTNFQYDYQDIQISGYFNLSDNNIFNGNAVIYKGQNSNEIIPNLFEGEIKITGDKITFSNFSGTWNKVFYSTYQKE